VSLSPPSCVESYVFALSRRIRVLSGVLFTHGDSFAPRVASTRIRSIQHGVLLACFLREECRFSFMCTDMSSNKRSCASQRNQRTSIALDARQATASGSRASDRSQKYGAIQRSVVASNVN
jgi:hypothetical protein